MGNVEFTDNRIKVEAALDDAIVAFLYEVAVEVEAQTKIAQTRVDTGHTKGEWTHYVDEDKGEAVIGILGRMLSGKNTAQANML